ncbi:MAG: TonB-dependent receptor, partial [Planctomycetales bacterium]
MNNRFRFYFLMLTVMLVVLVPVVASAQEITGSFRVTVSQPSGEPAVGEAVTVTDTRTGSARTAMTNDKGVINIRGLAIGGPFTIRVDSDTYRSTMVADAFTKLTGATTYNLTLEEQGTLEEVIVVASSMVLGSDVAIGPSSSFNIEQIEAMPSISREIRDIIRLDPRVNITRGGAGGSQAYGINCLGGSGRSNSFTIDGVRSADGFGLNSSGTSARHNFPIPFDVVRAASVEFAPIDVQYGHFTGCNVNVVTKSGGNEFNVSAFYLYSDDSMSGDSIDGDIVSSGDAEDIDWGFEFGGPIIKDKLFFYVAYEETDDSSVQNSGPIGGGFANEGFITMEEAAQIKAILASKYDRDVGEIVRSLPGVSERIFARIDWNINDNHRFEATYRDLEESSLGPDGYGRFDGLTVSVGFNVNGTEHDYYAQRLFYNWTHRFYTEKRFSSREVLDQP